MMTMRQCQLCSKQLTNRYSYYCNNKCQMDYQYYSYISEWRKNKVTGVIGINTKSISGHVERYLNTRYGKCCALCSWNQVNPITGRVPLEIDHIDGDSENNTASNLRMICPNCHALNTSYRNLNTGKGRSWRRLKYIKVIKITPP